MSQKFLEGLLSATESRVNSDQDAKCMVCLEEYNTLNTSTGIVEWEIRLPCGHQIGSSCIVTWLQANNNCPACRAIFFPAQPRPHIEHVIGNNDRPRPARVPRRPEVLAEELTRNFCRAFHDGTVFDVVGVVSSCMTPHLMRFLQNHTQQEIAAASIYMASHILSRPKTLIEISRVAGVSPNQIQNVYRQVYPNRMQCIDARNLGVIAGYHAEGMLAYLPPPDRGNGTVDDEEDGPEPHQHFPLHHLLDEVGRILAMNLGDSRTLNIISERIARRVVREIVRDTVLDSNTRLQSPPLIVATGLYVASHLLGLQTSPRRIADRVGVDERTLEWAYGRVYHLRNILIEPGILPYIGMENLPRALEALPALNWPPL